MLLFPIYPDKDARRKVLSPMSANFTGQEMRNNSNTLSRTGAEFKWTTENLRSGVLADVGDF